MRVFLIALYGLLLNFGLYDFAFAKQAIVYPQPGDIYEKQHRYPVELLKLVLSYQSDGSSIVPSRDFMTQGRAVLQLKQDKDIDVMWTMTSKEREQEILPIRIPIYKGLIGWRVFLSNPEYISKRQSKSSIEGLKQALMVQGHDWPDTKILAFNDFNVVSVPNYEGLFDVLSLKRAELFPRSVIEVWSELENYKHDNIILEPNLVISYPTATYFFVSSTNIKLAEVIEEGLRNAISDGRFDALFNEHYAEVIEKANLYKRHHFRLTNPLLPEKTPLQEKSLWFSLEKD